MIGRRVDPLVSVGSMEPGDYGLRANTDADWWVCLPNGERVLLDDRWTVTEHDGGTITVSPSIDLRDDAKPWHGWLREGAFTDA